MKKENLIGLGFLGAAAYATFSSNTDTKIKYKSNSNTFEFPDFISEEEAEKIVKKNIELTKPFFKDDAKYHSKKIKSSSLLNVLSKLLIEFVKDNLKPKNKITKQNFFIEDDFIVFKYSDEQDIIGAIDDGKYSNFSVRNMVSSYDVGCDIISNMIKDLDSAGKK